MKLTGNMLLDSQPEKCYHFLPSLPHTFSVTQRFSYTHIIYLRSLLEEEFSRHCRRSLSHYRSFILKPQSLLWILRIICEILNPQICSRQEQDCTLQNDQCIFIFIYNRCIGKPQTNNICNPALHIRHKWSVSSIVPIQYSQTRTLS